MVKLSRKISRPPLANKIILFFSNQNMVKLPEFGGLKRLLQSAYTANSITTSTNVPTFTLPDLPYPHDSLEPVISEQIMRLHHGKHHAAYVNNLNAACQAYQDYIADGDINGMAASLAVIKFNGGGHLNHSIFWKNLAPPGSKLARGEPTGKLYESIGHTFGSFERFRQMFEKQTTAIQGSGWGWLVSRIARFFCVGIQSDYQEFGICYDC